jgi:ABC-type branched-subunit amino acid transport system ATPase component
VRKLVGVGRAIASSPNTLLLDEPAAGLSTAEGAVLGEALRQVADRGVGLLLVEHDVSLVLSICDWIEVLEQGMILASGRPSDIREDQRVIDAYLGHTTPGDRKAEIK